MSAGNPSAVLTGIRKRFGATEALRGVDFRAYPGRISAVIGENGAGKSTLMKVLFGLVRADAGTIELKGRPLTPGYTPRQAIGLGVGMLQQHFSLLPAFTALENIILGCEPVAGPALDMAAARRRVDRIAGELGVGFDPDSPVSSLSVSARQQVEIVRMLFTGAEILIFDEPTATLAPQEIERFYALLHRQAGEGRTVILITHRLAEVLEHADYVTVLRRGLVPAEFTKGEMDEQSLISAIVPEAKTGEARRPAPLSGGSEPFLELIGVSCAGAGGREAIKETSLIIRPGEIFGIAGVTGSGQVELAETVVGLRAASAGKIILGGLKVNGLDTARRRRLGLVYIPEDRFADGVIPPFALILNRLLGDHRLPRLRRHGSYRTQLLREDVREKIDRYNIDAQGPDVPLATLSGGNQQKLMLARELDRVPRLIVAHDPTRGLDVISSRRLYRRLIELAAGGAAVMLISTELEDLLSYTHRMAVLFSGRLIDAGPSDQLNARKVGLLMTRGRAA